MLPLLFAMQAAAGAVTPPPLPPPTQATAPAQPAPPAAPAQPAPPAAPAPPPPAAGAPPPGYAPYPYYYPYPYPYPYPQQAPGYPVREVPPPPQPAPPERDVSWFARMGFGLGPPAFSDEVDILHAEGYGGAKFWAMLDGGYFFHPNLGLGLWMGLSRWSSSPHDNAPGLGETAYFIGGELPIQLGSRKIALVLAPRIGFSSGEIDLGGDVPWQSAFVFGAELSLVSFKYHLSGALGFLRAAVGPPGELGGDHDFGGLYVLLGGTIDG